MSPCEVESRPQGQKEWFEVNSLMPGDKSGIITNSSDGKVQIFIFRCDPDGSSTTVYRSRLGSGYEMDSGVPKLLKPLEELEVVKKLKKGESIEIKGTSVLGILGTYKLTHTQDVEKI